MSDLVKDIAYLRYYHTPEDALKDKDILKNISYKNYAKNVTGAFIPPLIFQFW